MNTNDGGPAFPSVGEGFGDPNYSAPGMSLRDYFAAKAMQGILSNPATRGAVVVQVSALAYEAADAMLEARKQS